MLPHSCIDCFSFSLPRFLSIYLLDGIAHLHWFGKEGMYNAMVVDLLGPNLKQVRRENEKFPLSFVIELGVQIVGEWLWDNLQSSFLGMFDRAATVAK